MKRVRKRRWVYGVQQNEGAKFWLGVMTELRNRGLRDVYIVCTDGLKGFPDAIGSVFPKAQVQTCIVHMIRASLNYVSWKERKALAADLKPIYRAPTAEAAALALGDYRERWPKHQVWLTYGNATGNE